MYGSHSAALMMMVSMASRSGGLSLTWVGKPAPPQPYGSGSTHRGDKILKGVDDRGTHAVVHGLLSVGFDDQGLGGFSAGEQ